MAETALHVLLDECSRSISDSGECGKERPRSKVKGSARSLLKKGRVKESCEGLLESSDNATYNGAITSIVSTMVKSSSEILFPTPVNCKDNGDAAVQQSTVTDRLKFTHPFSCPICDFVLSEPVTLMCGHTYCKKCLIKWKPNVCRLCKKKLYVCDFESAKANVLVSGLVKRWWQPELTAATIRSKGNQNVGMQEYDKALLSYSDALDLGKLECVSTSSDSNI